MKLDRNIVRDPEFLEWLYEETLENAIVRTFPDFQKEGSRSQQK
jgi:hypothetical protein